MKPIDFHEFCRNEAKWVDWDNTTDAFLHGDPRIEIERTAITWLATNEVIRSAAEAGCNFLICHEGVFYPQLEEYPSEERHFAEKRMLLDDVGITVYRCHDTWDRFPVFGIVDSWAEYLGFQTEVRDEYSFYKVCLTGGLRAGEVAKQVIKKTASLGQKWVSIMGDPERIVNRLVVGTGAITRLPEMAEMGGELLLTTDDGMHSTYNGLWSVDLGHTVITVCHATSEIPGMMNLEKYLNQTFPDMNAVYFPCGFPLPTLTGTPENLCNDEAVAK